MWSRRPRLLKNSRARLFHIFSSRIYSQPTYLSYIL